MMELGNPISFQKIEVDIPMSGPMSFKRMNVGTPISFKRMEVGIPIYLSKWLLPPSLLRRWEGVRVNILLYNQVYWISL